MLQALLHGKLSRKHENIEDILTSNVFGLLRYYNSALLLAFLSKARFLDGSCVLESGAANSGSIEFVGWQFWPYWSEPGCHPCEPDVVFTVELPDHAPLEILIESKLYSGKSSSSDNGINPRDQLACEWDNLASRARVTRKQPVLIYITRHFSIPRYEIEESIQEFRRKRGGEAQIAWLSWRNLYGIANKHAEDPVATDIAELLHRMDLTYFDGVSPLVRHKLKWQFTSWTGKWLIPRRTETPWRYF